MRSSVTQSVDGTLEELEVSDDNNEEFEEDEDADDDLEHEDEDLEHEDEDLEPEGDGSSTSLKERVQ